MPVCKYHNETPHIVQLVCTNEMWGEKKEKITGHVIQK
jgi:hypothetical protein